jgi:hypothetical protein
MNRDRGCQQNAGQDQARQETRTADKPDQRQNYETDVAFKLEGDGPELEIDRST